MPARAYATNGFFGAMHSFVPLFVILAYLLPLGRFVRVAVWEKEAGLVDALRSAGVPRAPLVLAWPAFYTCVFSLTGLLAAALSTALFQGGDFSLLLVLFLLYGFCSVAWGMVAVALFSRAKTATLGGVIAWLVLAFPFFGVGGSQTLPQAKWALSVLPPTAMALGFDTLSLMAASGQAPTWATVNVPVAGYSVSVCLVALALDSVLCVCLALYLTEVVSPRADRQPARPWHFLCSGLIHLSCSGSGLRAPRAAALSQRGVGGSSQDINIDSQHYVQVIGAANVGGGDVPAEQLLDASTFCSDQRVSLRHVTKRYAQTAETRGWGRGRELPSGAGRPAVDDVSCDILPGQVTVLLGHNGAGVLRVNLKCSPTQVCGFVRVLLFHHTPSEVRSRP
jgi:ABC-type multidrug transport system fused ATPase/permease subunit